MKIHFLVAALCSASLITAAPPSEPEAHAIAALIPRNAHGDLINALERRKGGGGGGGGKSGGGSSGGSSSSGKSGGTSGGSSSGATSRSGSLSNSGGRTTTGSGPAPAYGNRYAGGATVPYAAGSAARSPSRNIAPYAIGGAAVGGFGAYYAASWIYPVYGYYYPIPYYYTHNGMNRTSNVTCLCQSAQTCGCDPSDDPAFLTTVLTNGTNSTNGGVPVNTTDVRTVEFDNGTAISYINGSLPNGTTASGGTEDAYGLGSRFVIGYAGYSVMAATVLASIFLA